MWSCLDGAMDKTYGISKCDNYRTKRTGISILIIGGGGHSSSSSRSSSSSSSSSSSTLLLLLLFTTLSLLSAMSLNSYTKIM